MEGHSSQQDMVSHCDSMNTGKLVQPTAGPEDKKVGGHGGRPYMNTSEMRTVDILQLMSDLGKSQVIKTVVEGD